MRLGHGTCAFHGVLIGNFFVILHMYGSKRPTDGWCTIDVDIMEHQGNHSCTRIRGLHTICNIRDHFIHTKLLNRSSEQPSV